MSNYNKIELENYLASFTDETVIKFEKKFDSGDHWYTFVALKLSGFWYTTGQGKFTDRKFAGWLLDGGWRKHKILLGHQRP